MKKLNYFLTLLINVPCLPCIPDRQAAGRLAQLVPTLRDQLIITLVLSLVVMVSLSNQAFSAEIKSSATINIKASTYIYISGGYTNSGSGALINNGTIKLTGNFNNDAATTFDMSASNGTVEFYGTSAQTIGGTTTADPAINFKTLNVNNSSNITIAKNTAIAGTLTLSSGCLLTGTRTLSLASAATVSPAAGSATSFVDGNMKKTGNAALFTFPAGDIQAGTKYWAPLDIAAWDNTNDFTVNYTYKSPYDSLGINTWSGAYMGSGIDYVSDSEFWLIERTGAGSQVPNVTLYWKNADYSNIAHTGAVYDDLTDLALVHWNSGTSKWDNMGGTASTPLGYPTGQITNSTAFTGYSPVTFGSKTGINPLPIELLDFTATCNGSKVVLNWATASETNNSHFLIEKSKDGISWEIVTTIPGAGNSNQQLNYSATDTNNSSGTNYYRLGNVSYNGVTEYSNTVAENCNSDNLELISIYPNPAVNSFEYLVCTTEATDLYIVAFNVLGQVAAKKTEHVEKGINKLKLNISGLSTSLYWLSVRTADGKYKDSMQFLIRSK